MRETQNYFSASSRLASPVRTTETNFMAPLIILLYVLVSITVTHPLLCYIIQHGQHLFLLQVHSPLRVVSLQSILFLSRDSLDILGTAFSGVLICWKAPVSPARTSLNRKLHTCKVPSNSCLGWMTADQSFRRITSSNIRSKIHFNGISVVTSTPLQVTDAIIHRR